MKTIIVDGRLGKDAEVLSTKNGVPYLRLTLANDQFSNGERKTEWFDVITYENFIIEKKAEYLKKGRYVIVTGTPSATVNVSGGKVYQNLNINAVNIELPSIGARPQEGQANGTLAEGVSTFTGQTQSNQAQQYRPTAQPAPQQFQPAQAQPVRPAQAQAAPQQFQPAQAPVAQPAPQQFQPAQAPVAQPAPQQFQPAPQQFQQAPQQFQPAQTPGGFPAQNFGMPQVAPIGGDADDDLPF